MNIRDVPELVTAIRKLRDAGLSLPGPSELTPEGRTVYQHWIPCACGQCNGVTLAPALVVSCYCVDCSAPCPEPDCGLLMHEHGPDGGHEPIADERCYGVDIRLNRPQRLDGPERVRCALAYGHEGPCVGDGVGAWGFFGEAVGELARGWLGTEGQAREQAQKYAQEHSTPVEFISERMISLSNLDMGGEGPKGEWVQP